VCVDLERGSKVVPSKLILAGRFPQFRCPSGTDLRDVLEAGLEDIFEATGELFEDILT